MDGRIGISMVHVRIFPQLNRIEYHYPLWSLIVSAIHAGGIHKR